MRFNKTVSDVKLVVFDWNGTLLYDWPLAYGAIQSIFTAYGLKVPTEQEYRREIGANYMEFYLNHGISRPATDEGFTALKADLNRIRSAYFAERWKSVNLAKGAKELLRFLSDKKVLTAIVSAEQPDILQKRLVQFQIRSYFDRVHGGASGKDGKFNALRDLASYFDVPPENCVYVDDTYDGLMSAKLAGFRTIAILNGYNTKTAVRSAKPDFPAPSFEVVKNAFL